LTRLRCAPEQRKRRTALLGLIYDRFTEGFDTHDLMGARSLLDELAKAGDRGAARARQPAFDAR
jgi:hypothetical protein